MKSIKARKQRKAYFNAPIHVKQKNISAHLEENLLLKYDRRSIPLISGDTVKIMRGSFKGHEDKVAQIHVKDFRVDVEGVTITKADGKKIAKPLHPSNLLITKLNLTDKWRRQNLERKVSAETKKEIEAEAKQQIIDAEEEKKQREEARLAEEAETAQVDEKITEEEAVEEIKEKVSIKNGKQETKVLVKKDKKIEKVNKKTDETSRSDKLKEPRNELKGSEDDITLKADVKAQSMNQIEKDKSNTKQKKNSKKTIKKDEKKEDN
jgi:large subunit ribosomal protein L24